MSLRVLALAPPQFPADPGESVALSSADPASLFNACRQAAQLAATGQGAWGDSNWAGSRSQRRESLLLLRSLDLTLGPLRQKLQALRPNLLLIGSMSICLPGAIACAQLARECLGQDVCIVLGGRHPCESIYRDRAGRPQHHASSPLRLMAEGRIPPVFDVVAAGDGEYFIAALGELVARRVARRQPTAGAAAELDTLALARGHWLAGSCMDGQVHLIASRGPPLDYDLLPPPCALFGVRSRFNVFHGRPTAHVFSDVGGGCIYDCTFCSERRANMPALRQTEGSADRLFRQIAAAVQVIAADHAAPASVFVEDSTLLTYAPRLVERFLARMNAAALDVRIGAQLTIDQVLARPHLLPGLHAAGVEYLFVGIETFAPAEIGGLSKDVRRHRGGWIERAEQAFVCLREANILGGVAVLFGMGETQRSRLALIDQLCAWRKQLGMPYPVSLNWAVQHPLQGHDGGTGYTYTDWAIPEGPFLSAFRDFGEASVKYPLAGQSAPDLAEVLEVRAAVAELLQPPPESMCGLSAGRAH